MTKGEEGPISVEGVVATDVIKQIRMGTQIRINNTCEYIGIDLL